MKPKYCAWGALLLASSIAHAFHDVAITDSTHKVQINVRQCDWVGPSAHNIGSCSQPTSSGGLMNDGYVTVGGGGTIASNSGALNSGAMLVSSYLNPSNRGAWISESKDHEFPFTH